MRLMLTSKRVYINRLGTWLSPTCQCWFHQITGQGMAHIIQLFSLSISFKTLNFFYVSLVLLTCMKPETFIAIFDS